MMPDACPVCRRMDGTHDKAMHDAAEGRYPPRGGK